MDISRLDPELATQVRESRRTAQWDSLSRAIDLARIRCLSPLELVENLESIGKADPERRRRLIERLVSTELSDRAKSELRRMLLWLDEQAEGVSRSERTKIDRVISRLMRILDPPDARAMAYADLAHGRSLRRERAWQTLGRLGVGESFGRKMLDLFQRTGDQRCLKTVARDTDAVCVTDPLFMLENLEESYWRGRVFAAWIASDEEQALLHRDRYPWAFIYSVGKAEKQHLLHAAADLARKRDADLELQSIYAWTLGQLGAVDLIDELQRRVANTWKAETAHN